MMKAATIQAKTRLTLITIVGLNLGLIGLQILRYTPILAMPGSLPYILEPVVLLIIYGIIICWMTKNTDSMRTNVLRMGSALGMLGGVLEGTHLLQETFLDFGGYINGLVALAFMAGVFLLWGVASYRITRITQCVGQGILTSVWSAIVTILMTVLFGFILEFYLHIPAPADVATWGEFIRSGWQDIPAFTTANTLDSAFTHLLIGPLVGGVFGSLAGVMPNWQHKISHAGKRSSLIPVIRGKSASTDD